MPFPHQDGNGRLSYWIDTAGSTTYPPVTEDLRADVVIVGGGIVGITTAYFLARSGKSVVVVDRERLATAETGHTTAHLQRVDDTRLTQLVKRFGLAGAKRVWEGHDEAVQTIERIAAEERISCELVRLPAYLYSPHESDRDLLREEMSLARRIGYDAQEAMPDEVPFECATAIKFPDQGKFHVRKYLLGLVQAAERLGVRFFEGTDVADTKPGKPAKAVTRDGHTLTGDWLVQATNMPMDPQFRLVSKLMPYRTYAIGARVPRGVFGEALYWDTLDPYHYTRVERQGDHDLVILGGGDHEVGHETDTGKVYGKLEDYLRAATTEFEVVYRWSGEVIETADDLPYVGVSPRGEGNELFFTGDSGTGMTFGTLGAVIMSERVLGRGTPWDEMFDPSRIHTKTSPVAEWVKENVSNTKELVRSALTPGEIASVAELQPGDGGVMRMGLKKVAVSRAMDGTLNAVTATCTHMGCSVRWNRSEQSWDCPCHGGRYAPTGEILHGPPKDPLTPVDASRLTGERQQHRSPQHRSS